MGVASNDLWSCACPHLHIRLLQQRLQLPGSCLGLLLLNEGCRALGSSLRQGKLQLVRPAATVDVRRRVAFWQPGWLSETPLRPCCLRC